MRGRRKRNRALLLWLLLPVLLVILIYLGFAVYFTGHFYFGAVINGTDYTGRTVEEVEQVMASDIHDYVLTIHERGGGVEELHADQIGLVYVSDGEVSELLGKQNAFLWPRAYFSREIYEMSATTSYAPQMLQEAVASLPCFDPGRVVKPENAFYAYRDGSYIIVDEVEGNELAYDSVYELVKKAVEKGDTDIDLEAAGCYKEPSVRKDHAKLNKLVDTLNKYVGVTVTYDFGDRSEVLKGEQIKEWLIVNKYKVSIDEEAVRAYIDQLARTYNTFGNTRDFQTWDGSYTTVRGGDYGWLISRSVETGELIKVIKKGKSVKREPVYLQSAYCRNQNDIGDTYVEINLDAQHMWYFKDGECLVSTDIVSGNVTKKNGTPAGTYQITYKERNATLSGEDYNTPVSYWMPFNRNVGIHDAGWRRDFGGDIYKKRGSHGCINTPPDKAVIIYENIEAGVPVVVYHKKLDKEVLKQLSEE